MKLRRQASRRRHYKRVNLGRGRSFGKRSQPVLKLQADFGNRATAAILFRRVGGKGDMASLDNLKRGLSTLETRGHPLAEGLRASFEPRFQRDFSRVRTHRGAHAAGLAKQAHAQAFTYGRHIVFGTGMFQPNTRRGQRLLAHELAHTAQQGAAPARGESVTASSSLLRRQPDPALAEAQKLDQTARRKNLRKRVLAKLDEIIKVARQHDRRVRAAAAVKSGKGLVEFPSRAKAKDRKQRLDQVLETISKSHNAIAKEAKSPCRVSGKSELQAIRKPKGYDKADWDAWAGWQTGRWKSDSGKTFSIKDIWRKAIRFKHGGKDALLQDVSWFKELKGKQLALEKVGFNMTVKVGDRDLVIGFDPKSDETNPAKKMKLDRAAIQLGANVGYPFPSSKGGCRCLLWFSGLEAFAECVSPGGVKTSGGLWGRGSWKVAAIPAALPASVYFDFDVFKQVHSGLDALKRAAEYLKANPQQAVNLVGHTDKVGSKTYNHRLGLRRAKEIRRRLIQLGVDAKQIRAVSSQGSLEASSNSAQTRWKDRRVDIQPE